MTKAVPETIRHCGLTLTLYSRTPLVIDGREWFTYYIKPPLAESPEWESDGDSRLWEHCPETGRTVQTQ